MTVYINGKQHGGETETVDEFESYREAREMIKEYRLTFWGYELWLSSRSTKDWRESKK